MNSPHYGSTEVNYIPGSNKREKLGIFSSENVRKWFPIAYGLCFLGIISVMLLGLGRKNVDCSDNSPCDSPSSLLERNLLDEFTDPEKVGLGCEATVVIARHCEKDTDKKSLANPEQHCNYLGFHRAEYFSTLFDSDPSSRWPLPSFLFATSIPRNTSTIPHNRNNYREVETLIPLAEKANLEINSDFGPDDTKELADHIFGLLQNGDLCGKVALISWKHEGIPRLAKQLACRTLSSFPEKYPIGSYDQVWILNFLYDNGKTMRSYYQGTEQHINGTKADDVNNEGDGEDEQQQSRRNLKKKKHHKNKAKAAFKAAWNVYGTIQWQNFDPLAFNRNRNLKSADGDMNDL